LSNRLQVVEDLDIIRNREQVRRSGRIIVELSEERLVNIEAILIRIRNEWVQISVEEFGVTIVIETTTTILLSRLATVLPITVKIAAEFRLASTVGSRRRIKARIKTMDRGVAVKVSDTLVDVVELQADRGRSGS